MVVEVRVCERDGCEVEFTPRKPWQRFCCPGHRVDQWEADNGVKRSGTRGNASLPHRQADESKAGFEAQDEYVLRCLRMRGEAGVHTFELRQRFIGNPSQRIAELENAGIKVVHGQRERLRGRAHGTRYWLAEFVNQDTEREAA